jgi:hypothetical protein
MSEVNNAASQGHNSAMLASMEHASNSHPSGANFGTSATDTHFPATIGAGSVGDAFKPSVNINDPVNRGIDIPIEGALGHLDLSDLDQNYGAGKVNPGGFPSLQTEVVQGGLDKLGTVEQTNLPKSGPTLSVGGMYKAGQGMVGHE